MKLILLVFCIGTWSGDVSQVMKAMDFLRQNGIALSPTLSVSPVSFDQMDYQEVSLATWDMPREGQTVYLLYGGWGGFAQPARDYAVVSYLPGNDFAGLLEHEILHLYGATDKYICDEITGVCQCTSDPDIMCDVSYPWISEQTRMEIQ